MRKIFLLEVFAELFSKSDPKKVAKQIQSNILTGSFFKEVREGINGETDYVKVAALDFVYML